jgi:hypothetical protein
MNDLEKIAEKIKELAYQSKKFTWAIIAFLVLIAIAFPQFMVLVVSTTVVFALVKGFILLLKMISDK